MYDELTEVDIRKMQEEIDYRVRELRPQLIEEVQTARAFGDLSENYEYKCAKQAKNRNDSRIRYLERMIRTAKMQTTSVTTAPSSAPTEMIPRCRADRSSFSFSALSMTGTSRKDFLDYTPYPSH